jgi:hypothetical protein
MPVHICTRCGSNELRAGSIRGLGQVHFDLGNRKLFSRANEIPIQGAVCMECGHVELIADVDSHFNFNSHEPIPALSESDDLLQAAL